MIFDASTGQIKQFEYMEALIEHGKQQEAKEMLIQTFLASPQQVSRIRELHDQYLPDADFTTTGRMIQFRFGTDWKAALAKFVELYPGS